MADQKAFDPVPFSLVIGEEVSRGSYGVVFFATLNKNPVAVKEFHQILMKNTPKNVHFQNFRKECEQLKELAHANVVKFIGAYQGAKGPLLVMELMHETLEVYLEREKGNLSRERVLEICFSVCEGMAYLHGLKNPLIHRDLSSKNVLLTETGVVKIADFGQSKLLGDLQGTLQTTQPGTITYMPPEALEKKKRYTAKVDSFSLGVLLLEICTQSPPSSSFGGIGVIEEVKRREDDLRLLDDAHPLKPLIVWCLQYEELRPTVVGVHNHVNSAKASNEAIDRCKQLVGALEEAESLQQEKDTLEALREKESKSEVETLRRDVEDARRTIDSLQDDLIKTMEKYTRVMVEVKALHEEKEKRLRDTTEWDRNRQDFVRKQEVISKLEKKVEELQEEIDARIQHEQKLMGQIKRTVEENKYLEDIGAQLKKRAEDADRSRQELADENLTFKQIIDQFQSDFNQERKDREGAAGRFADQEKQWMEQIREANEERVHLKAVNTQLQEETVALKHEVDSLKLAAQERMIKEQETAHCKQEAEHKKREAALQKHIERLNLEVAKMKADLADKHRDRQGAKTLGNAYQRLHDEKVAVEHQLNTAMETHKITTQHIRELVQENQHLKASNEDTRRRVVQTTKEIQSLQEQYLVLSTQFAKMRDENERLRDRSSVPRQVPPQMRVVEEESSYHSLPQGPSAFGLRRPHTNESDFTDSERIHRGQDNAELHPQQGDRQQVFNDWRNPQYYRSQQRPGQPLPQNDLSRLQYDQPHPQYIQPRPQHAQPRPQHDQIRPPYKKIHPVYGDNQRWQQENMAQPAQTYSPENDLTERDSPPPSTQPVRQEEHLPQPLQVSTQGVVGYHYNPSHMSTSVKSLLPTLVDREGIAQEIKRVADQEKEPPKLLIVPEGTDEKLWPYDPNLVCPHCDKRFCHGQIREFRYHINDEHSPSLT